MTSGGNAWATVADGIRLRVRLVPKSSRDAIDGIETTAEGPALKARVRAVPENGKANAAVEKLIADWLDLPRSKVALASGHKSRVKSLHVAGEPLQLGAQVEAKLTALAKASGARDTRTRNSS